MTGDRDMFQCASDRVTILYVRTGGRGAEAVDPDEVRERYGVPPELVPDFIALRGDPSDGIPGAKGIGEKGAADLLKRHGSLEAALDGAIRETKPRVRTALTPSARSCCASRTSRRCATSTWSCRRTASWTATAPRRRRASAAWTGWRRGSSRRIEVSGGRARPSLGVRRVGLLRY